MEPVMTPVSINEVGNAGSGALQIQYAGFWKRFLAAVIDGVLLSVVQWVLSFTLGIGMFGNTHITQSNARAYVPAMISGMIAIVGITWLIGWLYFALMESSANQGTLGKMALGLRVTDMNGNRISFGKATARFFSKILSWIILGIGYMMAGFTEKKQALHDMIASTLVLSKQSVVTGQVAQNAFAG